MTTKMIYRLEETQRMLSNESSSDDDAEKIIPESSEKEIQFLFAKNDTEAVALTTTEDNDIMMDAVNMAVNAQLNSYRANINGTEDINHGLYTMCISDKVERTIKNGSWGSSNGSPSSSTHTQDVKVQSSTPNKSTKTKVVISKSLKKKAKKIECPGLKAYLMSFKKKCKFQLEIKLD